MPTSRHAPKARRARGARRSKRAPLGRGRARGPAGLRSHALGFGWWPATPSVRGRLFPQRACAVRGFVGLACKPPAKAGGPRQCSANRLASRKDRPADEPGSGAPGRSRHLGWGRAREPSLCNITKRSRPATSLLRSLQSWRPRPKSLMRPGVWTGRTSPCGQAVTGCHQHDKQAVFTPLFCGWVLKAGWRILPMGAGTPLETSSEPQDDPTS